MTQVWTIHWAGDEKPALNGIRPALVGGTRVSKGAPVDVVPKRVFDVAVQVLEGIAGETDDEFGGPTGAADRAQAFLDDLAEGEFG